MSDIPEYSQCDKAMTPQQRTELEAVVARALEAEPHTVFRLVGTLVKSMLPNVDILTDDGGV